MGQKTPESLASDTKNAAMQVGSHARDTAVSVAEDKRHKAATGLGSVAEALRHTGENMQDKGSAQYIARAADQVDRVSSYFENTTFEQMVGQVENFARREPAIFLGGSFVLGLLGARFLKSSGGASLRSTSDYTGSSLLRHESPGVLERPSGISRSTGTAASPGDIAGPWSGRTSRSGDEGAGI